MSAPLTATALAEPEPPAEAEPRASVAPVAPFERETPDDVEAPPEDVEPPFDPGPEPEVVVEASVPDPAPRYARSTATAAEANGGGIQRYGESVVREVLGATFLEEVETPGRTGFGERG